MGRERSSSRRAGMRQDRRRVAQIGLDRGRVGHAVPVQELPAVAHRDGIGIHVDDAGQGVDRLGQRVDVADGGQARANVEELVDALPGQDGDSAAQEGAVGTGGERAVRVHRVQRVEGGAVGREVGVAAERVVVDARRIGPVQVGTPAVRRHRPFPP